MSSTALQRPGPSPRTKLRVAIDAHNEERHRLDALVEAQQRARSEQHMARDRLVEAEQALHEAQRDEASARAYAFANHQEYSGELNISERRAELDMQTRKLERAEKIEATLTAEITTAEQRLRRRQHDRTEALAGVVCHSAEFAQLIADTSAAWAKLRTLRTIFVAAMNACSGYMDSRTMANGQASEPLELRVGYAADEALIERWRAQLERLSSDADTELPGT
jgi:hypothetical protein